MRSSWRLRSLSQGPWFPAIRYVLKTFQTIVDRDGTTVQQNVVHLPYKAEVTVDEFDEQCKSTSADLGVPKR